MQELYRHCKGLADPTRLRIVNLLLRGELCGCDLQAVLGLAQPNVSRHLIYLKNCGLVRDRREGFRVYYRLNESGSARRLFRFLREEFRSDPLLRKETQRLRAAIRAGACRLPEGEETVAAEIRAGVAEAR